MLKARSDKAMTDISLPGQAAFSFLQGDAFPTPHVLRKSKRAFDACTNLCKGGFSDRGKITAKGRKTAIVGCSELDQWYEVRRFQHTVSRGSAQEMEINLRLGLPRKTQLVGWGASSPARRRNSVGNSD